jgi:hypothetical protein
MFLAIKGMYLSLLTFSLADAADPGLTAAPSRNRDG